MKLETIIQKVKLSYPTARVCKEFKSFYIGIEDINGNIINIFDEYFLSMTDTVEKAWEQALLCCKTTQNFNRTHPNRLSNDDEEKMMRLKERSSKILDSRENNKNKNGEFSRYSI